jgi:YidC/Oxa1 family membrane protein insertase
LDKFLLQQGFLFGDKNLAFKKEHVSLQEASFVYADKDKRIQKRFIFPNQLNYIELEIEIRNLSLLPMSSDFPLVVGILNFAGDQSQVQFYDVAVGLPDKTVHLNGRKDASLENIKFVGLRNRYFCNIVEPASANYALFVRKMGAQESEVSIESNSAPLGPGQAALYKYRIYLGQQDLKLISAINPAWAQIINYGTFDIVSQLLLQLLEFLYHLVHSWGWAIILLSVIIYFALYPLSLKQMRAMKQMQVLQPRIEGLRKLHKDNSQKLNKEIMELYKEHKVNPLGGCLPMVLQIPVFFALYQALIRSIALKGARFFWIQDLSQPDRLFPLPFPRPFDTFNILPILMAIGMFVQQKMSMNAASGTSAEQQKIMLIVFPLMFGFIFYSMPAGLVLYWFINSALMLAFQLRMNKAKA